MIAYYIGAFLLLLCIRYLYLNSRGIGTVLDPGLMFSIILFVTTTAMALLYYFYFIDINANYWILWTKEENVSELFFLNVVFTIAFTFFYIILSKRFPVKPALDSKDNIRKYYAFYAPSYWLVVFLFVSVIDQVLVLAGKLYIQAYWATVVDTAYLILFSSILLKLKGINVSIFVAVIFAMFSMFIYYPMIASDEYIVNKGGVIKLLLFSMVFISLIKYRDSMITPFRFFSAVIFLPIFLGGANWMEAYVGGAKVNIFDLIRYTFHGYEVRMLENQMLILNGLDTGQFGMEGGSSYMNAIADVFFPFNDALSPSQWLAKRIDALNDGAFAFSFVAEGMWNFGRPGVLAAALIAAIILVGVRNVLSIKSFIMPAAFSAFVPLPYYIYRSDLHYIIKKVEFTILSLIILVCIFWVVRSILIHNSQPVGLKASGVN